MISNRMMNQRATQRIHTLLILLAVLLFAGCSTPSPAVEHPPEEREELRTPRWFAGEEEFVPGEQQYAAYATALAADSAGSARKGEAHARLLLESRLSGRLESIRREAASEAGAALDNPSFIHSLRKAEQGLSDLGEVTRIAVKPTGGHPAWRAFAEVTVERNRLIERLDRRLSAETDLWQRMKESAAFGEL